MSEKKISERAQRVLDLLRKLANGEIWIRQATLAEHFGCSRTTIWRCLKQLKEAGLIIDLNKRHEKRYKIYQIVPVFKTEQEEIEELLVQWGNIWQKQYPYFGTPNRPTLRSWVWNMAKSGKFFRQIAGQNLQEWIEQRTTINRATNF